MKLTFSASLNYSPCKINFTKTYSNIVHIPQLSPLLLEHDHLPCGAVGSLSTAAKGEWRHIIHVIIAHSAAPGSCLRNTPKPKSLAKEVTGQELDFTVSTFTD